jgi:hypothetical protein
MDPVTLIARALAAGNALRPADPDGPGAPAMQDAYACLWARVRRSLAGRPDGAMMLARHAEAPQTWEGPLMAELAAVGAADDDGLVAAAAALLRLAGEGLAEENRYRGSVNGRRGPA